MANQFFDVFRYETFEREPWGKVFYDCVLLKDAYKGIFVPRIFTTQEQSGVLRLWFLFSGSLNFIDISHLQPFTFVILNHMNADVTAPIHVIEDQLGIVIASRDPVLEVAELKRFTYIRCANVIKRSFRKSISDPSYKMCRDRLIRESLEMVVV